METANKLTYLSTKFFTENKEEYRITVTVSLDDDCRSNMCDWSVTADVRWKNQRGQYKEYMGGCCHDEVAKHFPELAKFISLHLCNHYGAPMYPVENGIYHVRRSGMSVAMEYLRISEQECAELYKASEDELYFKYQLFNLGIVDRWKRESEELIAELEKLCGKKWVNPYKPEEERFVLTLTDEERSLIEERIKAGHYSSENIEKRRVEAHKAKMAAKRAEICERYDKKIRQAEAEKKIILCVFDYGLPINNVIYYPHTNTLSFNWNDYGGKITQEEFDDFVNNEIERYRLATDSEKQRMIKALKKSKNPKAKEYLKRFFGIEERTKYEFKPFDKVLVRKEGNKEWHISLFAREIVDDYNGLPCKYECSNGTLWDYCIHFEGNEHLLGTAENPEK